VKEELSKGYIERTVRLKKDNYKLLSSVYKLAEVIEVKYLKTFIRVRVKGTKDNLDYIEKLIYADNKL
jgi:hypothetical protein